MACAFKTLGVPPKRRTASIPAKVVQFAAKRSREDASAALPAGFDPEPYLLANEDVRRAGADPAEYDRMYGRRDGCRLRP